MTALTAAAWGAPTYEAPLSPPAPLPYGLLSVADVVTGGDPHRMMGLGADASVACLVPEAVPGWPCTADTPQDKESVNAFATVDGEPFGVYVLNSCLSVGRMSDAAERAAQALNLGDGRAAEQGVLAVLKAASEMVGSGGNIGEVLAQAEAIAGTRYAGQPILHMDREVATWAIDRGLLRPDGSVLRTRLGTPVAAGAGYYEPGSSSRSIFVTGAVRLYRSDTFTSPAIIDPATNVFSALAERLYVPVIDCMVLQLLVTDGGADDINGGPNEAVDASVTQVAGTHNVTLDASGQS